jgi:outer membrane receptor protein involved in Fe transport
MTKARFDTRTLLLATAAAAAFASAAPAAAQVQEEQQAQPDPVAAATAEDDALTDQEIVVTAQKRAEDQQDVPISISVVSGQELVETGATQLTEIAGYVPGLHVSNLGSPGQTQVSLRGIAPLAAGASVGTYVDDAPVGSSTVYTESAGFTVDLLPYDLARIEVLRGPQGTLYGASTIGGLLKYVTITPDLNDFSARAGVEGFNIRNAGEIGYAFQAFVNVPIVTDRLAVTASFAHRKTPGWIDNVQTGDSDQNGFDQTGFRASLLWRPVDELSVRLSAMHQEIDSESSTITAQNLNGVDIGNGRSNFNFVAEPFTSKFRNYAASIDYDFGFASLSSTTTYTDAERREVVDASRIFGVLFPLLTGGAIGPGITPFDNSITMEKVTQEIRLTSASGGRFEWLLGFIYTDEEAENAQIVNSFDLNGVPIAALDPLAIVALPSTYEEYAFFGNATFRLTDEFWLSGGLRWAENDQSFRQISSGAIVPVADTPGESSESIVTYSISPQYHVNRDTMVYARVATGYRPGGPNVVLPGVPPTFEADTTTNYELGVKTRLANRTVSLDLALFRMDWKDIQVTQAFGGTAGLANGGTARSQGVEAALQWRPVRGLTLGANGAYTDSELTEDAPAIGGLDGDRLAIVPRFSGSLTANYHFPVGGNAEAEIGGGIRHTGGRFSSVESAPDALRIGGYTAVDLNGSVTFSDRYTVRAYVRNLTDTGGPITRSLINNGLGEASHINVVPLQPRTIGLALDVSF